VLSLLLACTPAPAPEPVPVAPELPPHHVFETAADALAVVLQGNPRVLGVGEFHETTTGPQVTSALSRFTHEMVPALGARSTDLVLETWVMDGACGGQEVQVTLEILEDVNRPPETESELDAVVRVAKESGLGVHALPMSCDDYDAMNPADGEIAYDVVLSLLTAKLRDRALEGLAADDAVVVLYGGAVHNNLYPSDALAPYSYATQIVGQGSYVELDLYVPEIVRTKESLQDEAWVPLLGVAADRYVLFERGEGSWILLLPEGPSTPR
jgi:hypothetical protein